MRITDTSDLWWKTAVVYCLDIETFWINGAWATCRGWRTGSTTWLIWASPVRG